MGVLVNRFPIKYILYMYKAKKVLRASIRKFFKNFDNYLFLDIVHTISKLKKLCCVLTYLLPS